jgi:hypothetical protein
MHVKARVVLREPSAVESSPRAKMELALTVGLSFGGKKRQIQTTVVGIRYK